MNGRGARALELQIQILLAASTSPTKNAGHHEEDRPRKMQDTMKKIYLEIYARQNGENVNPFGAMSSVAGDRSGPWTRWIGPAPV